MTVKFSLGQVVATSGVVAAMKDGTIKPSEVSRCIERHMQGDWGEVCDEDKAINDQAVTDGERILSAYNVGQKIWIITEADRSATTVLFPEEY